MTDGVAPSMDPDAARGLHPPGIRSQRDLGCVCLAFASIEMLHPDSRLPASDETPDASLRPPIDPHAPVAWMAPS